MHKTVWGGLFAVALTSVANTANGTTKDKELGRCSNVVSDVERLSCYDELAKKRGAISITKSETIPGVGKWTVNTKTSPIDDSSNVFVFLNAEQPIKGWISEITPTLIMRCAENKTEIFIRTGVQADVEYGSTGMATVTLRFDKEKAFKVKAHKSTDNKALFFQKPISFIKQMIEHEKMLFQFVPFNSSPTYTTFEISGGKKAVQPLREECGW